MQLTRRRVIAAAMDLIERDGAEAITMDRLATELGCGVMSLYNHVPSRSALLDGVADAVLSGIEITSVPTGAWHEQIRTQARAFRQVAMAHPRCTVVVVSRPPSSARMLRPLEAALATLCAAGIGGQEAVRIVRAFVAYIMGSVLDEIGIAPGPDSSDDEEAETHRLRLRPADFPQLVSLTAEYRASDPDADFEFGLELLVRAVAAMHSAGAAA
jgi:AcrR family transcriptional regulator